jgi:penicillin-binding protein 1A
MNFVWRILKGFFSSVVLAVVTLVGAPVAFGATVLAGLIFLPLPATIPLPKPNPTILPTLIFDRYGHQIAQLQQFDRNIPVTESDIPQVLKEAVISDEDRNFYHESGIDLRGTLRALYADIRNRAPVQGGSTITQQYVKLAYTNAQRTLVRKVREAILASQLARQASKDEILYRYLTIIYLGDGNYGVGAASETYFHIPVNQLNASQAATLAGLIPAPSARAPLEHLSYAEAARELVLQKMYQQGYLTASQYQTAMAQRLVLAGTPGAPANATVVYPEQAPPTQFPDFVDYVTQWLLQHYPASEVYGAGLRVQTTLDPAIQNDAYAAVNATLNGSSYPTDMALAAVEPQTGFVVALVGGRGYGGNGPGQQVNLALGGCPPQPGGVVKMAVPASCWSDGMISGGGTGRQPGSSWKPFTLATAFDQGIPPSTVYSAPFVYQIPGCVVNRGQLASTCQIHNDEGDLGGAGSETLAQATAQSTNTVYAQVAAQVGCPNVADTARKLGIETAYYSTPPFYYCQSYALGELGVSPLDMASAYGVFADHGQRAEPTPVLEIVNSQGKVLLNNISRLPKTQSVLSANVADNVTSALQAVLTNGTGTAAQLGRPAAGKTGTTSNTTDAWFVGYTPTLSTAVWMGREDSDAKSLGSVTGHFLGGGYTTFNQVYGGTWPAITWKEFMLSALAKVPATPFTAPAPIVPPQVAAALQAAAHPTTTTVPIEPGSAGSVVPTPLGGPYTVPAPQPYAPEPVTTPPPTTTTLPSPPTSTTNPTTSGSTTTLPLGFSP